MKTCLQEIFIIGLQGKEYLSKEFKKRVWQQYNFVFIMKSHLQSYPCPLQINSFWNLGFLLGITIILQIITGIYYGWCLRYLHSSGASFVFLSLFLHLGVIP